MLFNDKYEYDNGNPTQDNGMYGTPFNVIEMSGFHSRISDDSWIKIDKLIHAVAISNYPMKIKIIRIDNEGIAINGQSIGHCKFFGRLDLYNFEFDGTKIKIIENSYLHKQLNK